MVEIPTVAGCYGTKKYHTSPKTRNTTAVDIIVVLDIFPAPPCGITVTRPYAVLDGSYAAGVVDAMAGGDW